MKPAGPFLAASLLLFAFSAPAAAAPAKRPVAPPNAVVNPLKSPMVFFRAKGEPNACGPGCNEWIAAEGELTNGTAERMRAFLKREGGKRPIYFNSPGGITAESIAMGRLMRERGMTARVARTIPEECANESKECASAKRSGRELPSRLTSTLSQCNSACVYAIVGARTREIAPEAHLGIHASKTVIVGLPKNVRVIGCTCALQGGKSGKNPALSRRYGNSNEPSYCSRKHPARVDPRAEPRRDGAFQHRYPQGR